MDKYKTVIKYVWLILLVTSLAVYFIFPEFFTANFIQSKLNNNASAVLWIYVTLACLRTLFFIPATAILILGIALYPDSFLFLLAINMIANMLGGTLLYLAGNYFTPEQFFSDKKVKSLPKMKEKINKYGFEIVLGWSFFPFVPTDLICFVSGATSMSFLKFMTALFIGKCLLTTLYLLTGKGIIDLIF